MKSLLLILMLLGALRPASAATWIVDAAGGGDFISIQAAIDAAAPGDVLLVQPGNYAPFVLDRRLAILGPPGGHPSVSGTSRVQTDDAVLAGLRLGSLQVLGARGTVLLDDLDVHGGVAGLPGCQGMLISGCTAVHVARSSLHGKDGDALCESRALQIVDSDVTLTDCTLTGGAGWGEDFFAYDGQEALDVVGASRVLLAHCRVQGGAGGSPEILFGGTGGNGAVALRINWGEHAGPATVIVRGNSQSFVNGGVGGLGIGAQDAFAPAAGFGTLVLSGVTHWPANFGAALDLVLPAPAQPFMHLLGDDGPGDFKRLNLYGPAGAQLLLLASLQLDKLALPGPVDGTLWLNPATTAILVPVVLAGQQVSQNLTFSLPPSLEGLEGLALVVQGFAPGFGAGGTILAGNPVHLVFRGQP